MPLAGKPRQGAANGAVAVESALPAGNDSATAILRQSDWKRFPAPLLNFHKFILTL